MYLLDGEECEILEDSRLMARRTLPTFETNTVAGRLRISRAALGYTQVFLCELAGISTQSWNNYERGRDQISVEQAKKLVTVTDLTLDWIYMGRLGSLPAKLVAKINQLKGESARKRA